MSNRFHVSVAANNRSVTSAPIMSFQGPRSEPKPSQEFKDWMKAQNTGRVTTSGWEPVFNKDSQLTHFEVIWCFAKLNDALLFKLTFGGK